MFLQAEPAPSSTIEGCNKVLEMPDVEVYIQNILSAYVYMYLETCIYMLPSRPFPR